MAAHILAVAEVADGHLTKLTQEVATLARSVAQASGGSAVGLVVGPDPAGAAAELAAYLPNVVAVVQPEASDHAWAPFAAAEVLAMLASGAGTHILAGATWDGRDVAGLVVGATGSGYLSNASGIEWTDGAPVVTATVLGGKAVTRSTLTTPTGVITVTPGAATAEPMASAGAVEMRAPSAAPAVPAPAVLDRVAEAGAAVSLEEARVVVVGGRGVGGPEGFDLVNELAGLLGGVTGASRAAVDAGWIPYARQIGQTGKIVRPALYLGLGVSGAMQHRVGMQGSEAIVVVNRDPDAPMAEIADLFVVGDLFEVGPALAEEIRSRRQQ